MRATRWALRAGIALMITAVGLAPGRASTEPSEPTVPELWVDAASKAAQELGTQAAPFRTIGRALASRSGAKTIHIRPGEYRENLDLEDGVALVGHGETRPVIRAADGKRPTVVMAGKSGLEFLRVTGGADGILGVLGSDLRVVNCEIVDNLGDGIFFEKPTQPAAGLATIHVEGCLVRGNRDGIDVQGNRGSAIRCRLVHNRDDGLDIDGDADFEAAENEIHDNLDDGIEIRFKSRTLARLVGNVITGNGEDGIEIIDTPVEGAIDSRAVIAKNTVRDNRRHGIVGVDHTTENLKDGLLLAGVALEDNQVAANQKEQVGGFAQASVREVTQQLEERAAGWKAPLQTKQKTRYVAFLTGPGGCAARVAVGYTVVEGRTEKKSMEVTVRDGPPGATWDVAVAGTVVGQVSLGGGGGAEMEWATKYGSFPGNFPEGAGAGSKVAIGSGMSGALAPAADSAIRRLEAAWMTMGQARRPKLPREQKTKSGFVAYLAGSKSGSGRAELEYSIVSGDTTKKEFSVSITGGPPGGTWDIAIDGVPFARVTSGSGGGVQMQWSTKHGSLPIRFPSGARDGSVVTIGDVFTGKLEARALASTAQSSD